MGFYADVVFPRALDWTMANAAIRAQRQKLLAGVGGETLEIGFGTGLNLPHYPERVSRLSAVEISAAIHARARKRIRAASIPVDSRILSGEYLPWAENSFDSVVSTWTLCSIENIARALAEIRRVLKPEGRFFFIEHGLSPEPSIRKWQQRLDPLQKVLGCGCRLTRNMREIVQSAGFRLIAIDEFYLEKVPRTHGYMYRGVAVFPSPAPASV